MADAFLLKPFDEGSSLVLIDIEALFDGLFVVVFAPLFLGTAKQTEHEDVLFDDEFYHHAQFVSALCKHFLQCLCLSDSAGEAVEDDTLACGLSVVGLSQDVYHEFIGDELAVGNIALSHFAQFCSVLDFGTQHVARTDVSHAITFYDCIAVSAFTGTRSTENDYVLHLFILSFVLFSLL